MSRLALSTLLVLAAAVPAQDFRWPLNPIDGQGPRAVVVADFDLDGRPDFATAQFDSDEVAVVLAAPGGNYEPPILVEVGNQYTDLGVGDFDLDGRPDLVATNRLDPWLRIFDNASGWTWCGAQGAVVADALAVGDLNGDGRPDVVVADSFTNQARVFLTDVGGCPTAPLSFATGTKPVDVVVADLDGDGALDVVTCNETASSLSVLRGTGTGSLLAATSVAVSFVPTALVAADLDQDGDVDVAVSGSAAKKVRVFFGDGAGGLVGGATTSFSPKPSRLVAADLDEDGRTDLVAALSSNAANGGFGVMLGTGGGAFTAPVVHFEPLVTAGAVAVADMDEDGRLDVLADTTADSIVIVPGDGVGGFPAPTGPTLPTWTTGAQLADMDGDDIDDLVSFTEIASGPEPVSVQLGDGTGAWGLAVAQPALAERFMRLADLDGDGDLDLLTGLQFGGFSAALGDGAGGLGTNVDSYDPFEPRSVATADFDGDGDLDVLAEGRRQTFFGDYDFLVLGFLGDGAGGFTVGTFLLQYDFWDPFSGPAPPIGQVATGDLDGDGDPDLVFSSQQQSRVWLNSGGSFGAGTPIAAGNAYARGALKVVDYDDDGALDMVTANPYFVSVLPGDGAGGFGAAEIQVPSEGATAVVAADIDQDGLLDLVVSPNQGTFTVLRNDGAGGIVPRSYYADDLGGVLTSDVDGDGFPDVLTGNGWHPKLLINQALHGAWADLGSGLAGVDGIPKLVGTGTLGFHTPGSLKLSHANPSKLCALFISKLSTPTPFKGGVLVPVPPIMTFMLVTNPAGGLNLSWSSWPSPGPPGATWHFQYAIVDATAPAGVSLSNAVRGTQPGP